MVYEFVCNTCGKIFEIHASPNSISSKKTNCPDCKDFNVRRKYSSISIHYKGKGFTKKVTGEEEKSSPWEKH